LNDNKEKNPLFLPKGSIRAILAFGSLFSAVAMLFLGVDVPEWYYVIVGTSMGYYFGTRGVK